MISSQDGTDARLARPPAARRPVCTAAGARSSSRPEPGSWASCGRPGSVSAAGPESCARSADGAVSGFLGGASDARRAGWPAAADPACSLGWSGVTVASPRRALGAGGRSASGRDSIAAASFDRRGVPAARIVDPLGGPHPAAGVEHELDLPAAVPALGRVPLRVLGTAAERAEPLRHDLAKPRPRAGITGPAHHGRLRFPRPVRSLGQHGTLEPADPLDRNACGVGNLVRGLSGTDSFLDLLGSQGTLHLDLVLGESGELSARYRSEPVIDRQREATASARDHEDGIGAVLADCDEAQFVHGRPFRAGARLSLPPPSLAGSGRSGQHRARHVRQFPEVVRPAAARRSAAQAGRTTAILTEV